MIHTLFEKHRLEGAPNFRDLGGLPAADGKHIKYGRLLRCGHLAYITDEDARRLTEDYHLRTVIDMRTENEMHRRPDTILPHINYLRCPIFEKKLEGITRETAVISPVESALNMAHNVQGCDPHERMKSLYERFFDEEGLENYAKFFDLLLQQEEGAVLWHCTMGKDRCGTGAMLLEWMLGVPDELILADYLYTAHRLTPVTMETIRRARLIEDDDELMEIIRIMDGVHPDFPAVLQETAKTMCGTEEFVHNKLGMTEEKIAKLRAMYLE